MSNRNRKNIIITDEELKYIIAKRLPKLIKKEPLLREYISGIVEYKFADKTKTENQIKAILEELKLLRIDSEKKFNKQNKRIEEQNKRIEQLNKELKLLRIDSEKKFNEQNKRIEEQNKRIEEQNKRIEEQNRRIEEQNKRIEEMNIELRKLREYSEKRFEEHSKVIQQMLKEIKELHRKYDVGIGSIGARWGIMAETSFRDAIKGILEEDFPVKVERYLNFDAEGQVFGKPDQVELDIIIKDGKIIIAEIKSSMSKADVFILKKKIDFYEKKENRKANRVLIISPMVEQKALELARELGFEVYSYPQDINKM